jgi:hypothetical protein
MHQHQTYPQAVEQGEVVDQLAKMGISHRLAPECDDERTPAVGVYIRCRLPEPTHEGVGFGGQHAEILGLCHGSWGHSMPSLESR